MLKSVSYLPSSFVQCMGENKRYNWIQVCLIINSSLRHFKQSLVVLTTCWSNNYEQTYDLTMTNCNEMKGISKITDTIF